MTLFQPVEMSSFLLTGTTKAPIVVETEVSSSGSETNHETILERFVKTRFSSLTMMEQLFLKMLSNAPEMSTKRSAERW